MSLKPDSAYIAQIAQKDALKNRVGTAPVEPEKPLSDDEKSRNRMWAEFADARQGGGSFRMRPFADGKHPL